MFKHPAQKRRIELTRCERQVARIGLLQGVTLAAPRQPFEMCPRRNQLCLAQVHAGDVQPGKTAQQNLRLRTDATAHFQQASRAAVIDLIEQCGFQQARLFEQTRLFGGRTSVQVGRCVARCAHACGSRKQKKTQAASGNAGGTPAIKASK